jgi:hypothetical protein
MKRFLCLAYFAIILLCAAATASGDVGGFAIFKFNSGTDGAYVMGPPDAQGICVGQSDIQIGNLRFANFWRYKNGKLKSIKLISFGFFEGNNEENKVLWEEINLRAILAKEYPDPYKSYDQKDCLITEWSGKSGMVRYTRFNLNNGLKPKIFVIDAIAAGEPIPARGSWNF